MRLCLHMTVKDEAAAMPMPADRLFVETEAYSCT